jgi:CRP-like cAMP-binding protein
MGSGLEELGIVDDADPGAEAAEGAQGDWLARASQDARTAGSLAATRAALERGPLFSGLLPAHLERVAKLAQEVTYPRGEVVFRHGDSADALYVVLEGAVRISRNMPGVGEEALAILREGMHFGELALIEDDVPRSADATAHETSRLLRLPKGDIRDLMFVDRELAHELLWRFVRTLAERLCESNDRLLMLSVSSKF